VISDYSEAIVIIVFRGGALVELKPFDQRVLASNHALAATSKMCWNACMSGVRQNLAGIFACFALFLKLLQT